MNGSLTADDFRRLIWLPSLKAFLSKEEAQANWKFCLSAFSDLSSMNQPWSTPSAKQIALLNNIIEDLKQGNPVQYIAGKAPFLEFWLNVSPAVLIPRPETEELVLLVTQRMKGRQVAKILDLGTGSGCIAIGLKSRFPESTVIAADVSVDALKVAKENFDLLHLDITPFHLDVLGDSFPKEQFDLIVSNPPYIPISESTTLDSKVVDYEPELALFTPDNDPLLFYNIIAQKAKTRLSSHGMIAFETHFRYADSVLNLLQSLGYESELFSDMQGLPRIVIGRLPH